MLQSKWACATEWKEYSICLGVNFMGKVVKIPLEVVNYWAEPGKNRPEGTCQLLFHTSYYCLTLLDWLVYLGVKYGLAGREELPEHLPPAASSIPLAIWLLRLMTLR